LACGWLSHFLLQICLSHLKIRVVNIFVFAVTILITQQIVVLRIGAIMLSYFIWLKIKAVNIAANKTSANLGIFWPHKPPPEF
jgi:hypothetical protein